MQFVVGRADALHLPSRHRFAIFRLAAFLRLRRARPVADPTRLFFIERDQSAFEQYSVSIWVFATTAGLFCAALRGVWPWWAAVVGGIVLAGLSLQLPVVVLGVTVLPLWERLTGRSLDRIRFVSRFIMLLVLCASVASLQSASWPRWVGTQFVGITATNALAAIVMWVLRPRVSAIEQEFAQE